MCGHVERSPSHRKGSEIHLNRNISRNFINFEEIFYDTIELDCGHCNNKLQILKRNYNLKDNTFLFVRIKNESQNR